MCWISWPRNWAIVGRKWYNIQVTSKTNLRFWSSTHGCKNQTLLFYAQLFLSQTSKSSPPRHRRSIIKPAFFVLSPHHAPHSCWKHSYYAAHSTALRPRISPRTTPAPVPYICEPLGNHFPAHTAPNTFFSPDSLSLSLFLPLPSPSSLYLSLSSYTRKSERRTECRSIQLPQLEHRLLLSIAPRPQVRPSVRPPVPTRARGFLLAIGVKEGRRKQRHGRTQLTSVGVGAQRQTDRARVSKCWRPNGHIWCLFYRTIYWVPRSGYKRHDLLGCTQEWANVWCP